MTWFLIAVVIALGGIVTFYVRSKNMPVVVPKTPPPEGPRINVNDPEDLKRWSKELKVDTYDLKGAVQEAGVSVEAVKKELRDK